MNTNELRERLEARISIREHDLPALKREYEACKRVAHSGAYAARVRGCENELEFLRAILADLKPETPPTLDELRKSKDWFLWRHRYANGGFSRIELVRYEGWGDFPIRSNDGEAHEEPTPGDEIKRICDPTWTEVRDD